MQREALVAAPHLHPVRLVGGLADEETAIPAELRTCRAYLSFSPLAVNSQRNATSPIHDGMFGLPDDAL